MEIKTVRFLGTEIKVIVSEMVPKDQVLVLPHECFAGVSDLIDRLERLAFFAERMRAGLGSYPKMVSREFT